MAEARAIARRALEGVGDASLGEWEETSPRGVVHVRRRLTPQEAAPIGQPRDIRGTVEEQQRLLRLLAAAPHLAPYITGGA